MIPPLLAGNQLVSDILVKAIFFNDYFSKQCMTIDNSSSLPANIIFETEVRLYTFENCSGDIVSIIRSLDSNEAHRQDKIYIRMIRMGFFNFKTTGNSL